MVVVYRAWATISAYTSSGIILIIARVVRLIWSAWRGGKDRRSLLGLGERQKKKVFLRRQKRDLSYLGDSKILFRIMTSWATMHRIFRCGP